MSTPVPGDVARGYAALLATIARDFKLTQDQAAVIVARAGHWLNSDEGLPTANQPLSERFVEDLRHTKAYEDGDQLFLAEDQDPRRPWRRIVVAGIVEGDRSKPPSVVIATGTSDGLHQEAGVSTRAHASALLDALVCAWPDLFREAGGALERAP